MDDLIAHLDVAFWALMDKLGNFLREAVEAAGRKAAELLGALAELVNRLAAWVAAIPWWVSVPLALLVVVAVAAYLFRQRLYDRVLVYHLVWLRKQGFSRHDFTVRRGAVRRVHTAMARRVALPERFAAIAVYEVHPDRYGVAYGALDAELEDWRLYRRDLRAGLAAMGAAITAYFRANVRLLHADSELRALFAELDAVDADFAACRPLLPGEVRPGPGGLTLAGLRSLGGEDGLAA